MDLVSSKGKENGSYFSMFITIVKKLKLLCSFGFSEKWKLQSRLGL